MLNTSIADVWVANWKADIGRVCIMIEKIWRSKFEIVNLLRRVFNISRVTRMSSQERESNLRKQQLYSSTASKFRVGKDDCQSSSRPQDPTNGSLNNVCIFIFCCCWHALTSRSTSQCAERFCQSKYLEKFEFKFWSYDVLTASRSPGDPPQKA